MAIGKAYHERMAREKAVSALERIESYSLYASRPPIEPKEALAAFGLIRVIATESLAEIKNHLEKANAATS